MKKARINKLTAIVFLSAWIFIQLPVSLLHHHEEKCSLAYNGDISKEFHYHDDDEEECFYCSFTLKKSEGETEGLNSCHQRIFIPEVIKYSEFSPQPFTGLRNSRAPPAVIIL